MSEKIEQMEMLLSVLAEASGYGTDAVAQILLAHDITSAADLVSFLEKEEPKCVR